MFKIFCFWEEEWYSEFDSQCFFAFDSTRVRFEVSLTNFHWSNMDKSLLWKLDEIFLCWFTASFQCVEITSCGNFGLIGYSSGHLDMYNMQSGIYRGSYVQAEGNDEVNVEPKGNTPWKEKKTNSLIRNLCFKS